MTLSVAVTHTPWRPERVESMARLRRQVRGNCTYYNEFTEKEPYWAWSDKMWKWSADTGATHCLFIQDDTLLAPKFFDILAAMLLNVPDKIIGLESPHPIGPDMAKAACRWYSSTDCVIGVGYVVPRHLLERFYIWKLTALRDGATRGITEDSLLGVFAAVNNLPIYHPCPTIIDHDTTLESNFGELGNNNHSHRRPSVCWYHGDLYGWSLPELEAPAFWTPENPIRGASGEVPHIGRFYQSTPAKVARWVYGWTDAQMNRIEKDVVEIVKGKGQ